MIPQNFLGRFLLLRALSALVAVLVAIVGCYMLAGCSGIAHADGPAFQSFPCVVEDPAQPAAARAHLPGVSLDRLARAHGALCVEQRPGLVVCIQTPLAVTNEDAVAICSQVSTAVPADRWTLRVYLEGAQ